MPSLTFVILGIGFWWAGYFYENTNDLHLKLPKWFSTLLGRPNNNFLNFWSIAIQVMGYLLVIGAVCTWFVLPEIVVSQRVLFIWFVILLISVAIWLYLAPRLFK